MAGARPAQAQRSCCMCSRDGYMARAKARRTGCCIGSGKGCGVATSVGKCLGGTGSLSNGTPHAKG